MPPTTIFGYTSAMDDTRKSRRRWFQYSLRTLLLAMLLASIGMSWITIRVQRARRQKAAVEEIRKLGGEVTYDYEYPQPGPGSSWRAPQPPGLAPLRNLLGEDFFTDVVEVTFHDGSRFTDADLACLQAFPRLTDLTLANANVTDAGLERVRGLSNLRKLCLRGNQFTDKSLTCLQGLTSLEELVLLNTQITDAGLQHIIKLNRLTLLRHDSRHVTPEGEERFRQAVPNCRIEHCYSPE
jgi:hypothetical protein